MNWQEELEHICQKQPLSSKWGSLWSIKSYKESTIMEYIREATEFEWIHYNNVLKVFGNSATIKVQFRHTDGWWDILKCVVVGGPINPYSEIA